MNRYNVVLVGSNKLFRQGLRYLLDPERFEVAGESRDLSSWNDFVEPGLEPDVLLAELSRCDEAYLSNVRRLRLHHPDLRFVVLVDEFRLEDMTSLLQAGIDGYLVNDVSGEALSLSLLLVMKGEKALPSMLARVLAERSGNGAAEDAANGRVRKTLTQREEQILACLLKAYSNKHIARALRISEGTVKVHLKSAMRKIEAENRTQAALWARNNGIAHGRLAAG